MELNTELVKLIRKIRSEARYERIYGSKAVADTQDDIADAMERILWNCGTAVPAKKGEVNRGGWRTFSMNMYGVFQRALQS